MGDMARRWSRRAGSRLTLGCAPHADDSSARFEFVWEGLNFDLIITLSPEAHHRALELTRTLAAEVEYWPTQDPTGAEGNVQARVLLLKNYRQHFTERDFDFKRFRVETQQMKDAQVVPEK